jgi:hypothetical protein
MMTWTTQHLLTMMWRINFLMMEVMIESLRIGFKIRNKNRSLGII